MIESAYKYKAVTKEGVVIRGVLRAVDDHDLSHQLARDGLELVSCKVTSLRIRRMFRGFLRPIRPRDLIQFFVHLHQLEIVGIPILEALNNARQATMSEKLRDAVLSIHNEVKNGKPVSEALESYPDIFEPLIVSIIRAGEQSGKMARALDEVTRQLKWSDRMQSRIKKATRYPKILLTAVLLVLWIMMAYVVPQVSDFLGQMGQPLPSITKALISTSNFLHQWALVGVLSLLIVHVFIKIGRRLSSSFLHWTDHLVLNLPVFGPLIRKIALSRFCQMFGIMYTSGIPVLQCLYSAAETAGNKALVFALHRVHSRVQEGYTISAAMTLSGEFPTLVPQMIKIGEETANLPEVLKEVTDFFDRDVDEAIDIMIQMIEPILTVILGGMLLWIAAGVFGPVYDSFSTLSR